MAKLVSKVYGDALFETAMEKELVDILYEETSALLPILQANPELFSVLGNPQIVKEEKVALLHQVFSGKIAEELMGFLSIIVEKDRQNEMISILEYFIQRVKKFKKIGAAYVTSAVELGAEQKAALEKRLLETTGYVQFEMHYDVDTSLLGGHGHPHRRPRSGQQHQDKALRAEEGVIRASAGIISRKGTDNEFETRRNQFGNQRTDCKVFYQTGSL